MTENGNKKQLRSDLLSGVRVWTDVLNGRYLILHNPEQIMQGQFVQRLRAALRIVIPELDAAFAKHLHRKLNPIKDLVIVAPIGVDETIRKNAELINELDIKGKEFDAEVERWVKTFQDGLGLKIEANDAQIGLEKDGIVGPKTITALDMALNEIAYYRYDFKTGEAKTVHNAAMSYPLGKFTVVSSETGANFYNEPLESTRFQTTLPFNTRVLLLQILSAGWCFVHLHNIKVDDGQTISRPVYMKQTDLWTKSPMPEPFATLHKFQSGESLEAIIDDTYKRPNSTWSELQDRRYYANVLLFVNNPGGGKKKKQYQVKTVDGDYYRYAEYIDDGAEVDAAIFLEEQAALSLEDLKKLWELLGADSKPYYEREKYGARIPYDKIKYKAGFFIWLPSQFFADSLRSFVEPRSLTGGAIADARQISQMLLKEAKNLWELTLKEKIKEYWPLGLGFKLNTAVGGTFGIPIGLDADAYFYLWREDVDTIKMIRRGVIGGGPDAGVGLGAYLGLGKTPERLRSDKDKPNYGLGAELGAQVRAGARLAIQQEFTFPISRDFVLAVLSDAIITEDTPTDFLSATISHTMSFFNVDPNDYMTRLVVQAGFYVNGVFEASGGLRYGEEHGDEIAKWNNDARQTSFTKGHGHILHFLAKLASFSLGHEVEGEIAAGFEYIVPEPKAGFIDKNSGNYIPKETEFNYFMEGEFNSSLSLPVPQGGGGVKLSFLYQFEEAHFESGEESKQVFRRFRLVPYKKRGEMDIYAGSASAIELVFEPLQVFDQATISDFLEGLSTQPMIATIEAFRSVFKGTTFQMRLGFDRLLGQKGALETFTRRMRGVNVLIDANQRLKGAVTAGYVDFTYAPSVDIILDMFVDLLSGFDQQDVSRKIEALTESVSNVFALLSVGGSNELGKKLKSVADSVLVNDLKVTLHIELGAAVGFSFKAAAVFKVRSHVVAGGAILYHRAATPKEIVYLMLPTLDGDNKKELEALEDSEVSNYLPPMMAHLFQNAQTLDSGNTP